MRYVKNADTDLFALTILNKKGIHPEAENGFSTGHLIFSVVRVKAFVSCRHVLMKLESFRYCGKLTSSGEGEHTGVDVENYSSG
jgi:hypothetical protein